jgi:anti-sigma factor RsiW
MNCTQCQECLTAWQSAQLSAPEQLEMQAHLTQCPACADAAARLESMLKLLDRQEQPSPLLLQRFQERLTQETAAGSRWSALPRLFQKLWPTRPLWALSYSLSVLCVGLLGGHLLPPVFLGADSALPRTARAEGSALICPVHYSPFDWQSLLTTTA